MRFRPHRGEIVCVSPDLRPGIEPILQGFVELGALRCFVTTIGFDPQAALGRALARLPGAAGRRVHEALARREMPDAVKGRCRAYPGRELVRIASSRGARSEIWTDRVWWWAERGFDRRVAREWAGVAPFIYGFEMASAETFRAQKRAGGWCILGQLIAHHRTGLALFREEVERYPDAVTAYDLHLLRTASRVNELKDEQYGLSDLIVANSCFVKETFVEAGVPAEKIVVVPGAAPTKTELSPVAPQDAAHRSDRVIFLSAGAQSIRKGTPYLLQAWRKLGVRQGAELWMVGHNTLPNRLADNLPGITRIRRTAPRSDLFDLYCKSTVLVLPSLCEGFALVILEAMAHGLAIITTPNSGCGQFVEDGCNGWIVPIRDSDALANRMAWCLDNTAELAEMGRRSRAKARRWTWDDYARVHAEVVGQFMGGGPENRA